MSVHKYVGFLSLPYTEHHNQILYAKNRWLEALHLLDGPELFQAIFLLTIPSFEIHKAFPEVVFWTGASVYVYQLLFDFGTQRSAPSFLTLGISLVVFGEEKRIKSFPRGLGFSVSSPPPQRNGFKTENSVNFSQSTDCCIQLLGNSIISQSSSER